MSTLGGECHRLSRPVSDYLVQPRSNLVQSRVSSYMSPVEFFDTINGFGLVLRIILEGSASL